MTQEELGKAIGVDYKHVGAIERGVKAPSFDLLDRIVAVLKIQHYTLFLLDDVEIDIEKELKKVLEEAGAQRRTVIESFLADVLRVSKKLH